MIRQGQFADIPALTLLLEEAHAASIYADRTTFNRQEAKGLFSRAMQRHGHQTGGGSFVMVAEADSAVEGFIVGYLERCYHVLDGLMATDLFFICSERAHARSAGALLDAFMAWAEGNKRVIEIRMGVTNAIGDWKRAGKMYQRRGFEQSGALWERRVR